MTSPHLDSEAAPRPRRHWLAWLLSWKVGLPVAALLLAASGVLVCREARLRGLPDIGEPFDIDQFDAIDVAAEENAWPHYEAAGGMLASPPGIRFDEVNAAHENGWDAATLALKQWLEDNRQALERWRLGTTRPFCLRVRPSEIAIDTFAGSVQEAHTFTDLAILMALRLESEGDPQAAWGWHRALFRFSRHRGMHDAMIERLVGNAIHAISLRPITRWSANPVLGPKVLLAALSDVREDFRLTAPPSIGLKYEYLLERDTLARLDEVRDSYRPPRSGFLPSGAAGPRGCPSVLRVRTGSDAAPVAAPGGEPPAVYRQSAA